MSRIQAPSTDPDALMNSTQTRALCGGVTVMALYKWRTNPESGFPQPIKIGQINYWRRRDLLAWFDLRQARTEEQARKAADRTAAATAARKKNRTGKAKTQNSAPVSTVEPGQREPGSAAMATGRPQNAQVRG